MKRKDALRLITFAGYHGDRATFTRLYIEHRISLAAGNEAFRAGARAKERGIRCGCSDCTASSASSAEASS